MGPGAPARGPLSRRSGTGDSITETQNRAPQAWLRANKPDDDAVYASSHREPFGVRFAGARAASPRRKRAVRNAGARPKPGQVALQEGLRSEGRRPPLVSSGVRPVFPLGHIRGVTQSSARFLGFFRVGRGSAGTQAWLRTSPRSVHPQRATGSRIVHSPLLPSSSSCAQGRWVTAVDRGLGTRAPLSTTNSDHTRSVTLPLAHALTSSLFAPDFSPPTPSPPLLELPAETLPLVYCQPVMCPALY